ncbi:hypothetical protein KW797_02840 [Candidatus Parcubacteria bacterium]|nr:hypothetical protein [Candidatus Parcubacteria bacterium]
MTDQTPSEQRQISAAQIGRRLLAKRKLHPFMQYVDQRFNPTIKHVEYICHELDQVLQYAETGEGTQVLVLTIPPRHYKTTLMEYLSALFLGRNPEKKVIYTTYASGLAFDCSRRVRATIRGNEEYKNLFGDRATTQVDEAGNPIPDVVLDPTSRAVDRWQISEHGGLFQAVGFDGTLTGRGGHMIIVDDPHASRKEAESQTERNNAWTFIISTLWSRLEKNGVMVFIMQRWTEDDVVGRLQRVTDPNSDEYIPEFPAVRFINLPALAEHDDPLGRREGEALHPGFKDEKALAMTKGVMGDYHFNSQYQQRATAPEGNLFKRNWFRVVPYMPFEYKIQYWDTAESEEGDYWACATLGVNKFGITLFDMFRKQMEPAEGQEEILRRYDMFNTETEPVAVIWVEKKSSGGSMVSLINAGDRTIPIEYDPVKDGDKVMRAGSITTVCKNRRVGLIQHAEWIAPFLDELCSFPRGKYDDQVDCFVGGVGKLVHGGFVRIQEQLRRAQKKTPEFGSDYRERTFGRDGRGLKPHGASLRRPPSAPTAGSSGFQSPSPLF